MAGGILLYNQKGSEYFKDFAARNSVPGRNVFLK
jgi:hypothetical protein